MNEAELAGDTLYKCDTIGMKNFASQLKIIGMDPMIYRRSWPIEAMMGVR